MDGESKTAAAGDRLQEPDLRVRPQTAASILESGGLAIDETEHVGAKGAVGLEEVNGQPRLPLQESVDRLGDRLRLEFDARLVTHDGSEELGEDDGQSSTFTLRIRGPVKGRAYQWSPASWVAQTFPPVVPR